MEITVERPQSALTHEGAGEVFQIAERQPVRIRRRGDAPDEVLLNYERYEAETRFLHNLLLVARALQKGVEQMPDLEGLQWTKLLEPALRRQMLLELLEAGRASVERQDAAIFNRTWKGWASTGEVLNDPEQFAALTRPIDPAQTIPLVRP